MAENFIFTMQDLRVVRSGREILKGIYLSFFPGAKIGVIGPNGAGKSTLLRIMAGVDVELRRELWSYVRKLKAEGTTIILTTHYLEEAEELADRVGIINEGRLLLVEDKRTLIRRLGERQLEVRFSSPVVLPDPLIRAGATLVDSGNALMYVERQGRPGMVDVLRQLYEAGLPVAEVSTRHSSLEDVLLLVLRGIAMDGSVSTAPQVSGSPQPQKVQAGATGSGAT